MARALVPPSIRIGLQTLRGNPLRTVLSTLGVIMGVASLVAVLSIGDGIEQFARQQIEQTTDLQTVGVAPRTSAVVDGMTIGRTDWPSFTPADAAALQALVAARGEVSLTVQGRAGVRTAGSDSVRAAMVFATDTVGVRQRGLAVAHGRPFSAAEVAEEAPVAVVSHRFARTLAPDGDLRAIVGDSVRLQETSFTIVGVLAPPAAEEPFSMALVPFTVADRALTGAFGAPPAPVLRAHLARVEDADSVRAEVERWAAAQWGDRVEIQAGAKMRLEQVSTGMLIMKLAMGSFAAIAIVVGGIGIMNVLLASVFERTREIGVRKAVGARNRDILTQFLAESVAITGTGSAIGAVLGLAGAFAVTAIMRAQTEAPVYAAITIPTLLVAAVVAVVTGVAFGSYPAVRAARLSPIDAIRHE